MWPPIEAVEPGAMVVPAVMRPPLDARRSV